MATRIVSCLVMLLVFFNTSAHPLLARDPCPIFSKNLAVKSLISFSRDEALRQLEVFVQLMGLTKQETIQPNSTQVFLWSQPRPIAAESQPRIAYIKQRLADPTLQTEVLALTLRTTKTATVPRLKFQNIKFSPNLAGVAVLATSVFLLFTDRAGLGITILVLVGIPTALQLLYYALRTSDPSLFISQAVEKELRNLAWRSDPREWSHIGFSFSGKLQPESHTLSAYQTHYRRDIRDLDYWYMDYPHNTQLVTRLREDLMAVLDRHYGYATSTLDIFFVRQKWQKMKLLVLVTHPEKKQIDK